MNALAQSMRDAQVQAAEAFVRHLIEDNVLTMHFPLEHASPIVQHQVDVALYRAALNLAGRIERMVLDDHVPLSDDMILDPHLIDTLAPSSLSYDDRCSMMCQLADQIDAELVLHRPIIAELAIDVARQVHLPGERMDLNISPLLDRWEAARIAQLAGIAVGYHIFGHPVDGLSAALSDDVFTNYDVTIDALDVDPFPEIEDILRDRVPVFDRWLNDAHVASVALDLSAAYQRYAHDLERDDTIGRMWYGIQRQFDSRRGAIGPRYRSVIRAMTDVEATALSFGMWSALHVSGYVLPDYGRRSQLLLAYAMVADDPKDPAKWLAESFEHTQPLVAVNWPAIARVAEVLRERRQLSADELEQLIDSDSSDFRQFAA